MPAYSSRPYTADDLPTVLDLPVAYRAANSAQLTARGDSKTMSTFS